MSTIIVNDPWRDNAHYILNFTYITFISIVMGAYAFSSEAHWIYKFLRSVTFINAAWFGLASIGEIINLWYPEFVINSLFNNDLAIKVAFVAEIGITGSFFYEHKKSRT